MARLDWSRLHSKILRSSIWLEDPIVRLVWICALADSETDGSFYGSYEVLARAWNLAEPDVKRSMERLCAPDPKSSTPDHEGRRIIQEGANEWRVLNKRLYNPLASRAVLQLSESRSSGICNASQRTQRETKATAETH